MKFSRRSFLALTGATLTTDIQHPLSIRPSVGSISVTSTSARSSNRLQTLLNEAGESAIIEGDWELDSTVLLPHSLRSLEIAAGARVAARGNHPVFARRGQIDVVGTVSRLAAGATRFAPPSAGLKTGDYILLAGLDTIPNSSDKYGYLRRVVSSSSTEVVIDRALPRTIANSPRCGRVSLAPPIRIFGKGKVFNTEPSQATNTLIEFLAVDSVVVTGIEVLNNGGPGITLSHCWGGDVSAFVHDLLDDGKTHFGYGVNIAGSTRDARVGGSAARVRHAVTTSPGPSITGFGNAGEPETCTFEPTAWDCTDKAIDTHRAGWGITIVPHVKGGRGGVQVRADNTKVVGGTVVGTVGPGVAVAEMVAVPPTIDGVAISDLWPSGNGILALSPVVMKNVSIRDCAWVNIILQSNSTVSGGSISAGHPTGVEFRGSNNTVTGIALGDSVTTPYVEASGATNNIFEASGTKPSLLPAPESTALPTISGTLAVKSELTASTGSWSRTGFKYTWTWRRDNEPIAGAVQRTYPRYVIATADQGHRLTVEVTAKRVGYTDGRAVSLPTATVGATGKLTATTAPVLSGTAQAGKFLYISKGTWEPYPSTISFQWLADGTAIAGATAASYQVRSADNGKSITARVTAERDGYAGGSYQPDAILVGGATLKPSSNPAITGTSQVGKFLYVSRGEWTPYPSSLSFQWTVDGAAIGGATSTSYQIRASDSGKAVGVTVTAKRAGYADGVFRPTAVRIGATALVPTTRPTLTGTPAVGKFLYASRGERTPYTNAITFQWTVAGAAVSGATSASYQIKASDSGKPITVVVTASRSGYQNGIYRPPTVTP
ncbi:hypothetical protein [Microbacterium sp. cf332]|uniref:hypothetical protein n=1 Tax=Microbacterium sp. cf332 TaxID=1761804 RepID=UPI00088C3511|nr:hypothetical protein [Microbacterium sp. cf332]SDQ95140.1 hypothetical protein SAMN04487847_3012 [Microbacterium sp. cf332]